MSNSKTSGLTGLEQIDADRLAYIERDRWPELEQELRQRRPRKFHFGTCSYDGGRRGWEWLVYRCRSWTEVEKVLNRHKMDWERKSGEIVMDGMSIYRQ
jgi:hypothetical protein